MLHINPEPLPPPPSGFVHISNVSDGRDDAPLDKRYKAGQAVRARVIGFRLVDGLATLSMKKSVLDQQVCVCVGGYSSWENQIESVLQLCAHPAQRHPLRHRRPPSHFSTLTPPLNTARQLFAHPARHRPLRHRYRRRGLRPAGLGGTRGQGAGPPAARLRPRHCQGHAQVQGGDGGGGGRKERLQGALRGSRG